MSVFVTNVASMIGIGVAVDYSLFVLARYREEIRGGAERAEARRVALRTSGLAVTFSGITVMLSLAGLFLVDSTTIRSMAMGAIIVVAVSILAAVTLLPVLMRLLGRRAYARGRLARARRPAACGWCARAGAGRARPRPARGAAASGSAGPPRSRAGPWSSALAAAAVLLALAIPALSLDVRRRRAAPVPGGQRDARGRRAGRAEDWARARRARRRWSPSSQRPRDRRREPRGARLLRVASCARDPGGRARRARRSRRATAARR